MKKILVVEDDDTIHRFIKELLERENYIVKNAYSGTEAVSIIENDSIDLILLDLMLPGINGEDIVKKHEQGYFIRLELAPYTRM